MARRPGLRVRLYLKSGQVLQFFASDVTATKLPDGEYDRIDGSNVQGEVLKGFTPGTLVAWTIQKRRWWQW